MFTLLTIEQVADVEGKASCL